jgi:hypothetical protein
VRCRFLQGADAGRHHDGARSYPIGSGLVVARLYQYSNVNAFIDQAANLNVYGFNNTADSVQIS